MQPRSAGKLHLGNVTYTDGTFSVEMLFVARQFFSREDEFKSAALAARRHFMSLLGHNGFTNHGPPEVDVVPISDVSVAFRLSAKATRGRPVIVSLPTKEPDDDDEDKGGDQVRH